MLKVKFLLLTNIITAIALLVVLWKNNYHQRIYNKIDSIIQDKPKPISSNHSYSGNELYVEQTDYYTMYTGKKDIVMLGNSLTAKVSWTELLNRQDVANRGIGTDITEGFINRLNSVFDLNPKICFIEGGLNDLIFHIPQDTIIKNINILVDTLLNKKIIPVIFLIPYASSEYENAKNLNQQIKEVNKKITLVATKNELMLIDLNTKITDGFFLKKENTTPDGLHFSSKVYLIWKEEIEKILKHFNI